MTAIDPHVLTGLTNDEDRAEHIRAEVARILRRRGKNDPVDITNRSERAVHEIIEAIGPRGAELYEKVLYSSEEGPDHEDDWTREAAGPVGRAKHVIDEFCGFLREQ